MISARSFPNSFPNDSDVIVVSSCRYERNWPSRWSFTYCRERAWASAGRTEHALEGHNLLCWHKLSHRAQGARDKGTRDPDTSWTSIAKVYPSVRQDAPLFALFFARYSLAPARPS